MYYIQKKGSTQRRLIRILNRNGVEAPIPIDLSDLKVGDYFVTGNEPCKWLIVRIFRVDMNVKGYLQQTLLYTHDPTVWNDVNLHFEKWLHKTNTTGE